MIILRNPPQVKSSENVEYAKTLVVNFILSFQKIYGMENVTFNIHALSHITEDVKRYGSLERYSAFIFESYLCSIKKLIREGDRPLQQISRRL